MTSEELEKVALQALQSVSLGVLSNEAAAMKGIGYSVLALLQFLRESEQNMQCCDDQCKCESTVG